MAISKKKQQAQGETKASFKNEELPSPLMAEIQASATGVATRTRGNRAAYIERTQRFTNIEEGLIPFNYSKTAVNTSNLDVRDAVILCQKAYYNIAIFRNTIDLMSEFSVGDIHLEGGNKKSRDFFYALFKKMNLWNFQDQFFREYYRSGNVFIYRFDYKIKDDEVKKITQTFGASLLKAAEMKLPAKYSILNPADIQMGGNISFASGSYFKVLSDYEVARLKYPKTDQDREVFENLPDNVKKTIKNTDSGVVTMILDPKKTYAVFYKKQDYEPFAVPLGFPVLEDLNYKKELRKMDMAISRTMQQAILLVTTGTKPGEGGINPKNLVALQSLFQNESVGRVLVADYTTDAKFVIPQIADILDPKKYEVLDRDIREGLGNILLNEEKFANVKIKMLVFVQKLNESRKAFLKDFLIPEMKRVGKEIGFRSIPSPTIQDIDFDDKVAVGRIYTRMVELGILTPEEGLRAVGTGMLPSVDESIDSQIKFKELKQQGLYEPLIGGKAAAPLREAGRPAGTGGEGQVETSRASEQYSMKKLVELMDQYESLEKLVKSELRAKHNKKRLTNQQNEFACMLSEMIARNVSPKEWNSKNVQDFIENPVDRQHLGHIDEIAASHDLDFKMATLLSLSKIEPCQE
jgi:hypothetical protein|uniref:hypothetical protein n=1 Tax=Flavobacterium sp. TaxID=239 RepID=UPI00404764BE